MFFVGLFILLFSVFGGYLAIGGNIAVLFKPSEWLIIVGAAIGSYIIANPPIVRNDMLKSLKNLLKGTPYTKDHYMQVLMFMFNFFKYSHANGIVELENHIDNSEKSEIFNKYDIMIKDQDVNTFFCDYFRMVVLGFDDFRELENMMENDIESRKFHTYAVSQSLIKIGDALPALGIVAAVLGVITAMSSVGSDPSILAPKIASALVGTFIGAFTAYGLVNPIGYFLAKFSEDEIKFLECIKSGIIAHLSGYPPTVSIEFARQAIPDAYKPSFAEIETGIENI
ncbi:MAG: chemotaxis protein MotA [Candidatus Midichloriaceae bacterium]|jgi:chemotaxis protein MotA